MERGHAEPAEQHRGKCECVVGDKADERDPSPPSAGPSGISHGSDTRSDM